MLSDNSFAADEVTSKATATKGEPIPAIPPAPNRGLRATLAPYLAPRLLSRCHVQIAETGNTPNSSAIADPVLVLNQPEAFYRRLATHGLIGLGESYQAGDWETADLPALLCQLLIASDRITPLLPRRLSRYFGPRRPRSETNTSVGARRNISRHYDISNELFELFLGSSMTYSAAIFPCDSSGRPVTAMSTLDEAQHRKNQRLLDLAHVGQGSRLLEIGTGWGGLAIDAANRGADVHTITLSASQYNYVKQKITGSSLANRIRVELRDYRELDRRAPKYDAIISVEMIEAVGEQYWPTYFALLSELLRHDGRVALQVITMRHDRFLIARHQQSWVNKYILPGLLLPSVSAIEAAISGESTLRVISADALGPHYEATLRLWRQRFHDNESAVRALGFDQTFIRTWNYFLACCQAGFTARHFDVYHYILGPS